MVMMTAITPSLNASNLPLPMQMRIPAARGQYRFPALQA
jgi:hypothetical protein